MSFPNPKPNETPDQYVTMEIDESIIIEGSSGKVVNSEKDSAEQELRNLPENNENPGDDDDGESESGISLDDDVTFLSDNETPVEQFTALTSTIIQNLFRLSDVAIDSLIKFFQQILMDANQARFKNFPSSLYTATKLLQVGNQSKTYAVCPSCNSLYNIAEVVAEEGSKCTHVEFSMQLKGKPCGMELTMQAPLGNRNKNRPKLLFPLPNLKLQINSLYQRSGIQQQLRKWTNRHVDNGMLTDIYDGKI
uniref:Uncharacterized protein n=1 Tax=Rhizophagus irregularis (strain DAOM 181602 / DAOM 197198 / MUCL 43194) TaxID=747089 RepID=U9UBL0_RHIID